MHLGIVSAKAGHLCWVIKHIDFGFSGQKMFRSVNERVGLLRLHNSLDFWFLNSSKQFIPNALLFSADIKLSVAITASLEGILSDGHDKPFCTKAITIINNFKKVLSDTDNR